MSLARESTRSGRVEQLFRVGVYFLRHVSHPTVVPDGVLGQRVHCGYVSCLPRDGSALTHSNVSALVACGSGLVPG